MPEEPTSGKVTAILLSWRRAHNIARIVDALKRFRRIGEIILWNNNSDVALDFDGVTVINSPRNFLCIARHCMAPLAANDTIWFQDDDLLLRGDQFDRIHAAYAADPSRIYGIVGRNIVNGLYSADAVYGECDIVLGQAMLFHRKLLHHAFEPFGSLPPDFTEDDILFSLASGRSHFAVDVSPVEDLGSDDEESLWRKPGHFERRQRAVEFMLSWRKRSAAHGT